MQRRSYYIINGITFYRVLAAPLLFYLIFSGRQQLFTWLLGISFFTDAIDGFLARHYKVTSLFGARLDSIGDDLTVVAAISGLFIFERSFIEEQALWIYLLLALFILQIVFSLVRYRKITSFHTVLAKISAVLQGSFILLFLFFAHPIYLLFYIAVFFTALDLIEEIALVFLLPEWKANVKGIYCILKKK